MRVWPAPSRLPTALRVASGLLAGRTWKQGLTVRAARSCPMDDRRPAERQTEPGRRRTAAEESLQMGRGGRMQTRGRRIAGDRAFVPARRQAACGTPPKAPLQCSRSRLGCRCSRESLAPACRRRAMETTPGSAPPARPEGEPRGDPTESEPPAPSAEQPLPSRRRGGIGLRGPPPADAAIRCYDFAKRASRASQATRTVASTGVPATRSRSVARLASR